jgi:hypothetical protein
MVFEDGLDLGIEARLLMRVTDQISDHPDIVGVGQFDDDDDIWAGVTQRWMDGVPGPGPAIQAAASGHAMPSEVGRVAFMADLFGTPLKSVTALAALHHQFVTPRRIPEFLVQSIALSARERKTLG